MSNTRNTKIVRTEFNIVDVVYTMQVHLHRLVFLQKL